MISCLLTYEAVKRTHEEVVRIGIRPADAKQLHKVVELAMDVAADCDWAFLCLSINCVDVRRQPYHWLHIGLLL